ncbi:hypothetical protein [Yersinia wautersii]|uniref:hypothetical protein n=1 Tax=Yersinia wautersii TaxID=1341643 RepID=UPI000684092F|nr:hypothetical protein [Yersinia wautersii]
MGYLQQQWGIDGDIGIGILGTLGIIGSGLLGHSYQREDKPTWTLCGQCCWADLQLYLPEHSGWQALAQKRDAPQTIGYSR